MRKVKELPSNWNEAFHLLERFIEKSKDTQKKIIFIDEMPWMDTPKSDFVSALENFWNGWANMRDDIVLVACGSATSWMVDKLLHNQGGLFNRITQKIYLRPFKLSEMEQYLDEKHFGWNRYQIAQCYMILGGIPFYLTLLNPKLSLLSNIDELFFADAHAMLRTEYNELYSTLFIQYTYARIQSIMRKAHEAGVDALPIDGSYAPNAKEVEVIQKLDAFKVAVKDAGENYNPAGIANYCYELTKLFNQFYHDYSILSADTDVEKAFRLKLAANVGKVIKNGMGLLGIEVPERM